MTHPPCDRVVVAFDVPIRPEPWRRAGSNGARRYMDPKSRAYKKAIADACIDAMRDQCVKPATDGDLYLWCLFEKRDARRCDGDNAYKAIADALNGIAYKDDRQVVDGRFHTIHRAAVDRVSVAVLRAERGVS